MGCSIPGQADDVQVGYQATCQFSLRLECSSFDQNPRLDVQLVLIELVLLHCAERATCQTSSRVEQWLVHVQLSTE